MEGPAGHRPKGKTIKITTLGQLLNRLKKKTKYKTRFCHEGILTLRSSTAVMKPVSPIPPLFSNSGSCFMGGERQFLIKLKTGYLFNKHQVILMINDLSMH